MKMIKIFAAAAGIAALAACNQSAEEQAAENIEANASMEAENIMDSAENQAENIMDTAENQAANVEAAGENAADAVADTTTNSN